ncbi:glypican-5 [Penaeus vannamei]|uniref:glypican-5 n=1 Tax=Penaeus vannamei TaxID=6689 RepID=UPI00387F6186
MWRVCAIVLCLVGVHRAPLAVVGANTQAEDPQDPAGCAPPLEFLVQHNVAAQEHLAQLPSNGSTVCGGGQCCVPEITEVLLEAGRESLREAVRATAADLHQSLTSHRDVFYGVVEKALSSAEHRTLKLFQATYPRLAPAARPVLHELVASMKAALTSPNEMALEHALAAFWDDLFAPVYHNALHSRLPPFSQVYSECLRDAQRTVQPWGIIPALVGEPLLRGLRTVRLFLHSLDVGIEVVNSARKFPVPSECGEAAARLRFCGACHGTLAPPCFGMCLNVARGCLAPLAEVDGAWGDLAGTVARVHESLQASRLSHLLHQLPEKLSEAVMVALERGPKLQKKVRRECGAPTHHEASSAEENHAQETPAEEEHSVEERATSSVLDAASATLRAVEAAREWWAGVADNHCKDLPAKDDHCWNGVRVAPYTKMTAGVGVSAQKYNSEVRVGRPDTSVYAFADRLRGVRRLVLSYLTWLPKADSQRRRPYYDGSGSGGYGREWNQPGGPSDDEDEGDYFGSGNGSGDTVFITPVTKTEVTDQTQGASAQHVSYFTVSFFALAASLYFLWA